MPAWGRAREAIVRHPVDLFVLQQLGELAIAAARLRESSWVRPHLDEAAAAAGPARRPRAVGGAVALGGAAGGDRRRVARGGDAAARRPSSRRAAGSRYAAAMAAAAPHWVAMLDAEVDADAVEKAARGLHAVGLTWEGGRLAGQAAIRTRDRKAMSALLGCARALPVERARTPDDAARRVAEPEEADDGPLRGREREVAALVLEGLTYKQIGEQLFISAKTVEHHVARMRQRLGSGSRGELFAHLRQIVGVSE